MEMHRKSLEIATLLSDKSNSQRAATNLAEALKWYSALDISSRMFGSIVGETHAGKRWVVRLMLLTCGRLGRHEESIQAMQSADAVACSPDNLYCPGGFGPLSALLRRPLPQPAATRWTGAKSVKVRFSASSKLVPTENGAEEHSNRIQPWNISL